MKKNELIEIDITDMTNLGFGVARFDGIVVFISGAVTGDRVLARIIKLTPSYAVGRLEKLLIPSSERSAERCSVSACKSCAYKYVTYESELKSKRGDVAAAFKKAGLPDVEIREVLPSPSLLHYRNKAQYPITRTENGEYVIGFFAPKSHRVTEARSCPLAPKCFPEILETLADFFKANDVSCYDEKSATGLLRHVYLRRGEVSGEVMLVIVINGRKLTCAAELGKLLQARHPEIKAFMLNVNREKTNVVLGDEYVTVFGDGYIIDTLAGVELQLSAPSFYQVNHDGAELLYAKVRELAQPTPCDVVLDLFCGVGSIGLSIARDVKSVIGIEIVESAVEMARHNAQASGIDNAEFYTGDATDTEALLKNAERERGEAISPTLIILDPPRGGCSEELIRFTARLAPRRLVYVSCNPQTLARDVRLFGDHGYKCDTVYPVDMFPGTGHVECAACLTRK